MKYDVKHNENESRFEITINGHLCEIDYTTDLKGNLKILHTGVPMPLEGQGIAAAMTKCMLEYARENNLKVYPFCPYTSSYLQRHPEYEDVVAPI